MVRPEIQFRVTIAAVVFGLLLAAALWLRALPSSATTTRRSE